MLHVTNGDVVAGLVRDARLPGAIVPWQDVLHEGPVPGLPFSHEELRDVRARFIETCGWSPYEAVYGMFAARDGPSRPFRARRKSSSGSSATSTTSFS